jgi:hypothetical protein
VPVEVQVQEKEMARDLPDEYMPYAPAAPLLDVLRRIREGRLAEPVTLDSLAQVGIAEGNAPRVLNALRFMGLVDEDGRRTEQSDRLRRATTEEYPAALAEIVQSVYARVLQVVNPATASDIQLNDAFRPFEPSGQRPKMVALFQALAREATLLPGGPVERRPRVRPTQDAAARSTSHPLTRTQRLPQPPSNPQQAATGGFFGLAESDLRHLDDSEFEAVWDALGKVTRAKLRATATTAPPAEPTDDDSGG